MSVRCDHAWVPTLTELVHRHTELGEDDLDWLHALVSDWQLLADLSFADLVLWVPLRAEHESPGEVTGWVAVSQMRPTTGPTSHQDDMVGSIVRMGRRPFIDIAWREGRICRESDPDWNHGIPVREETIPVRRDRLIGVIQRSTNLSAARTPSRLELTYLQSAGDLAQMIADGRFPFTGEGLAPARSPRVGDGLLRLDRAGRVSYASPNALSAYRRLGLEADLGGAALARTTAALCPPGAPVDESLAVVAAGKSPLEAEVEANGAVVQLRSIPLYVEHDRIGALILVRDVTELRHRERELMTKDATIREIHHRVKNNLQTVAALLRLQARRLDIPEGRLALNEAVRRVGSIAIVHETLSHTPEGVVDFDDIADRVIAMAGDVSAAEARIAARRTGRFGSLPAMVASPLAMVLTELLQNAVQHGLPHRRGSIEVAACRAADCLSVLISDDGRGVPADFDIDSSTSLGLQIVRTLVVSELGGKLDLAGRPEGGTQVRLELPLVNHGATHDHPRSPE